MTTWGRHMTVAASAAHRARADADHGYCGYAGAGPSGRPPGGRRLGRSGRRRAVVLGFSATCALLACLLPATAGATTNYDMRGEWSTLVGATHQAATPGVCVIGQMELTSGQFSGNCEFDGGLFPGTISGTVSGASTSVTITIPAVGISYIVSSATIETVANSVSGPGIYYKDGVEFETGPLTLMRTATYAEVQAREARELKEREAKEKEARELKEHQEKETKAKEAKEKEARELKEHQEKEAKAKEAKEKEAQELKEHQEKEAREAAEKSAAGKQAVTSSTTVGGAVTTLVSAEPTTKTAAESRSRSISLKLTNPNAVAVTGHFALTDMASVGKASSGKSKTSKKQAVMLGERRSRSPRTARRS